MVAIICGTIGLVVNTISCLCVKELPEDENWQRLVNALQKLNEIDKSIMLLYMEDYSYEEIAGIVGISSSAVGVKIHRLKGQLQKQFKK